MPLNVYVCTCGGSENTARQLLKASKNVPWLEVPIVKGKKATLAAFEKLPDFVKNSAEVKALNGMLGHKSKFVIFLGYSTPNQAVIWADVASGKMKEKLDGQMIAERYFKEP